MTRYVALLRGINVGGNNLIPMPKLRACFESLGLDDVRTYIASGNVLFSAGAKAPVLVERIEKELSKRFGYAASIVLRSKAQMQGVVGKAPRGFGTRPDLYRYDVLFLRGGVSPAAVVKTVPVKEGVDQAYAGRSELYFSRLVAKATQSRLSRLAALPVYRQLTIRNWNTTTRLLQLLEEPDQ